MSEHVFLLTIFMVLCVIATFFVLRAVVAIKQAKVRLAEETSYRATAEKALIAQTETAVALAAIQASLVDMKTRLASVEKILKDVE